MSQAETTLHWSVSSPMQVERSATPPVLLNSGLVLLAGGHVRDFPDFTTTSELYNPYTNTWQSTGNRNGARARGVAVRLDSGKVLMIGGNNNSGAIASAELYDPDTGTWSSTGGLPQPRMAHQATLLQSGKVLVTGGVIKRYNDYGYESYEGATTAALYDPATGACSSAGSPGHDNEVSAPALLYSGEVLLVSAGTTQVDLYDPSTNTWRKAAPIPTSRSTSGIHNITATRLYSGSVLVVGGSNVDVYDPYNDRWTAAAPMNYPRFGHTATLLYSGQVLVAGGGDSHSELYEPVSNTWTVLDTPSSSFTDATAVLLHTGQVLVAGGFGYKSTVALFTP